MYNRLHPYVIQAATVLYAMQAATVCNRLQPYVIQATTVFHRLQPSVMQAATVCNAGCNHMNSACASETPPPHAASWSSSGARSAWLISGAACVTYGCRLCHIRLQPATLCNGTPKACGSRRRCSSALHSR